MQVILPVRTCQILNSALHVFRRRIRVLTFLKLVSYCVTVALLALTSTPQTLSPGEVSINSHIYHLKSPVLRTESGLVQVEVVVRDRRGHPVAGLTKDDFALFDSGHRRNIPQFAVEKSEMAGGSASATSAVPPAVSGKPGITAKVPGTSRSIALFFDDVNTPSGDLARAKIAARRFISEATRTGDRIGVFTTSQGQIVQFTTDSKTVLSSLTTVQSHPRMSAVGLTACPRMTPYEAYLIVNNDPATTQSKLIEACNCPGENEYSGCEANDTTVANITSIGIQQLPPDLRSVLGSVISNARATWNQTRLVTQTTLDAVRAAIGELAQSTGDRILLFASSGFLSGDLGPEEHQIVDQAVRANVAIDSLDSKGLYAEQPGGPQGEPAHASSGPGSDLTIVYEMQSLGDKLESEDYAMADFAESTGGLLFRDNNDLDLGFRELGIAPAYAYILGFRPEEDGKYHKIKVGLRNGSHDFIQVRPGYFAPMKETKEASQPAPQATIDAAMSGTNERSDFPMSVSVRPATGSTGLTVQIHVDIGKLPFEKDKDRHGEKLIFVAGLFDAQGKFVSGKEADMALALKQDSFERFSKAGITGEMSLEAPTGSYRLRVVVEEGVKNELSATSQNVQIP